MLSARLIAGCILLLATTALAGEKPNGKAKHEWPMISGDSGMTAYSQDPRIKPPFRLKWANQDSGSAQLNGILVAGGKVHARGLVLDAETGEQICAYRPGRSGPPAFDGKRIIDFGSVYDVATKKHLWKKPEYHEKLNSYRLYIAPTFHDGVTFQARKDKGSIYIDALKVETGAVIWSTRVAPVPEKMPPTSDPNYVRTHKGIISAPTVAGGMVLSSVFYPTKAVFALDAKTGKEVWRQEGICAAQQVGSDGKAVWAAEGRQGLWQLDLKTGKKLWHWGKGTHTHHNSPMNTRTFTIVTAETTPCVVGDLLMISAHSNFAALDRKTGKKVWDLPRPAHGRATGCGDPTAAGDLVYSASVSATGRGKLRMPLVVAAAEAKTGKYVWRNAIGASTCAKVALAYGRLHVPSKDRWVYCFEAVKAEDMPKAQAAPAKPAGPLTALAKPFGGKPGTPEAGGKPKGGTDWPMYGGCPERCGLDVKVSLPIKQAWKFKAGKRVRSSPVIAGGVVYVGSDSKELYALDLATGGKKWSAKVGAWIRCAPAVAKGIVVAGADDGVLRAFDAKTGKPKWEFKTAGHIRSAPAIVGERVVFGSWDGHCYCVRLSDGKEYWRYRPADYVPGTKVHAAPAVARGVVYVGLREFKEVHAIDLGTGKPLAGYDPRAYTPGLSAPLAHGVAIYRGILAATGDGGIDLLRDATTGKVLGKAKADRMSVACDGGAAAFNGGKVIAGRCNVGVRLADVVANRKIKAPKFGRAGMFDGQLRETPLVAGDLIIAATTRGVLEARRLPDEKADGPAKQVWKWSNPSRAQFWTAPAAAGGFIVVGSDDGHVYGFSYAKGK